MERRLTLFILLSCLVHHSGSLTAQEASGTSLTVTPSVGMGVIPDNGELASGGMTTFLEIDLSRARWRWSVFAAVRGIGVGCSDGCDSGGQGFGLGISYSAQLVPQNGSRHRILSTTAFVGPMRLAGQRALARHRPQTTWSLIRPETASNG